MTVFYFLSFNNNITVGRRCEIGRGGGIYARFLRHSDLSLRTDPRKELKEIKGWYNCHWCYWQTWFQSSISAHPFVFLNESLVRVFVTRCFVSVFSDWNQSADNYRTINRDEHFRFIKHDMRWFPSVITIFITASFSSQIIMCVHACWIAACWGGRNRWKRSASSLWLNHGWDRWIFFHCHSWYCVTEFLPAWTSITRYSKTFKIIFHATKVEGNHSVSVLLWNTTLFFTCPWNWD